MRLFKPFIRRSPSKLGSRLDAYSRLEPMRAWLVAAALACCFVTTTAAAKDLSDRLGVGFNNEFSNSTAVRSVPALSAKYGLSKDLHMQGVVGFNTVSPAAFTLGAKLYRNIFYETNLNFYMAGGAAYLKDTKSAFELLALLGAEFFIPGLDSLGFLFDAGISANNVTGSFAIKTVGFTFLHAGMHFYF